MASGTVRPTTISTKPISEIETAFRTISSGKHTGKVILTVAPDQQVKALPPVPEPARLRPDALYIVVGGLGGLGQSIIKWMAQRGARNVVTLSRSGAGTDEAKAFLAKMSDRDVSVVAKQCDIGSKEELTAVLAECAELHPEMAIGGLIHSAMALEDAMFSNMTQDQWRRSLSPKVSGCWNLHDLLPQQLDFFIMLSSIVAITGHAGQGNYAAACSFQDSFAQYLRSRGRQAHSINVGPVSDAGFVSETPEIAATMKRQGFGAISVEQLLLQLDHVVTGASNQTMGTCQTALGLVPAEADMKRSSWINHKRFAHVVGKGRRATGPADSSATGLNGVDYIEAIRGSQTLTDAEDLVCSAILYQLSRLIGAPVENLTPARTLDSYGVDSLVAVELRNWIGAYLQANVPLLLIREAKSITQLSKDVAKVSRLVPEKIAL